LLSVELLSLLPNIPLQETEEQEIIEVFTLERPASLVEETVETPEEVPVEGEDPAKEDESPEANTDPETEVSNEEPVPEAQPVETVEEPKEVIPEEPVFVDEVITINPISDSLLRLIGWKSSEIANYKKA